MNDTMTKSANINSNCSNNNNRYQNVISKIQNGSIINSYIINNNSENPNSNTKASNSNTVSTAKKNSNINSAGKTGSSDVHRMMENLRIENKGVGNISKQEMIQRIIKMIQEWKNQMYTTVNQYEEMIEHYNEAIHKKNQEISSLRQIADKYVNTNNPQLYF